MQLLIEYILPNVLLFGSIYVFGKAVEHSVWYAICNYSELKQ
jgi:hypothetical protein